MPFADPEKKKAYGKQYRDKKTEEFKKLSSEEKQAIKDKQSLYRRKHYEKDMKWLKENREKAMKVWTKQTLTDLQRDMNKRVAHWRRPKRDQAGVPIKSADWDEVYKRYIQTTHCEFCGVKFEIGVRTGNKRCLDHHHSSGEIRNILCNSCNAKRKIPDLRFMYVLQDLHRYFITHQTTCY